MCITTTTTTTHHRPHSVCLNQIVNLFYSYICIDVTFTKTLLCIPAERSEEVVCKYYGFLGQF